MDTNDWLKTDVLPKEVDTLLEIGNLLNHPFNSNIQNLEIENSQIIKLILSNENLSTIPDSIANLQGLKVLKLQNNKLTSITDSIGLLKNLEILDIDNNLLTTLPKAIENLTELKELWIRYNLITEYPECLAKLKQKRLKVRADGNPYLLVNSGEKIDKEEAVIISKLRTILKHAFEYKVKKGRVISLKISPGLSTVGLLVPLRTFKFLNELPEDIGNLKYLEKIYLGDNSLTVLPKSFGKLTKLREIDLSKNKLINLPEEIGNLQLLNQLNLDSNSLTELPESIGNLTQLKSLGLYSNDLKSLPSSIGQLTHLKEINLDHNRLTTLPDTISQLSRLEILNLRLNLFNEIPPVLEKCRKIKNLDISNNPLTSVPHHLRKKLTNLSYKEICILIRKQKTLEKQISCPKCNIEYNYNPDAKFCPICMTPLTD